MTEEKLAGLVGEFTWLWSDEFFIETKAGNFLWSDPDYGGDNSIHMISCSYTDFIKNIGLDYGRDKGKHFIGDYCGNQFSLVKT